MDLPSLEVPFYVAEKVHHPDDYIKSLEDGRKIRRMFHFDHDSDELRLINEIKTLLQVNNTHIPALFLKNMESNILRFLYAHRLDPKATFHEHFKWLSVEENFKLSEESFHYLEKGIIYMANCDLALRPIIIVNTFRIDFSNFTPKHILQALFALLNLTKEIILVPGHIENWVVIVDLGGFFDQPSLFPALCEAHLLTFIETLQLNYPNYLEKLYFLNLPSDCSGIIAGFKQTLSSEYQSLLGKTVFLPKDEIISLQENIPISQLEKRYGGTFPDYEVFWPPKNIINPQILKLIMTKSELLSNIVLSKMHENEDEEGSKKRKVPKFRDLSYSPLRVEPESHMQTPKFRKGRLFVESQKKQFLFDDWESLSGSSRISDRGKNPNFLRENKFIEDLPVKHYVTENGVRESFKQNSTRELYQAFFQEKYKKKISYEYNNPAASNPPMKLNQSLIQIALRSNKLGGFTLDLKMRSITTIMSISDLVKCADIDSLILSFNYLKSLEDILLEFKNLVHLDISVNHLKEIKNLEASRKLEHLDLSTNRISKIENLDKLKSLLHLDLSMNYIEKIENLNLPVLKTLILNGNQIKYLENLQNLQSLEHLEVSKNKIESLGCLSIPPAFKNLKRLICTNNLFSLNYLDDLVFSMQNLPNIEELDFSGNELTSHKQYKYRLLYFHSINRLDGIEVKGILKNHLETMKKTNEYDHLLERAKSEALEKLKADHLLKQEMLSQNYAQEREVDLLYERYENNMQNDLDEFVDFMFDYQKQKANGTPVELSQNVLSRWKNKIILADQERERLKAKNEEKYEQIQKMYLDSKLTLLKPEKAAFYDPKMDRPHYWADDKAGASLNVTSNSTPDKHNDTQSKWTADRAPTRKEVSLNKSTDSKIMTNQKTVSNPQTASKKQDPERREEASPKTRIPLEESIVIHPKEEKNPLREISIKPAKSIIINPGPNKLKTLLETEDDKISVKESSEVKARRLEATPDRSPLNEDAAMKNPNEWEQFLQENEEGHDVNRGSQLSVQSKKKRTLKIDTTPRKTLLNGKKADDEKKKPGKSDFLKDEKLKEKLDKLAKSILDNSEMDSHSISRNNFSRGNNNDVDWKAKRQDFLQRLKERKNEEESMRKQTVIEGIQPKQEKKMPSKSKKCEIF